MTIEIRNLMEERRKHETKDPNKCKEVQRKNRQEKERWLSDKCKQIEALDNSYDSFNMYKKIKDVTDMKEKSLQ